MVALVLAMVVGVTQQAVASAATPTAAPAAPAALDRSHLGMALVGSTAPAPSVRGRLLYYGGPVISNMVSVPVSYGPGTYVSPGHEGATAIPAFSQQLLGSGVLDWLSEYDTPAVGGTGQHIGRGTVADTITITPAASRDLATVYDSSIQAELVAQINAHVLPAPTANTSYAVFFRNGQKICQSTSSCSGTVFCAYHGTFVLNGTYVTY